jgi:diguanylate cyclase (GGDEF)-like protein/PAS domain S-box-containing protein
LNDQLPDRLASARQRLWVYALPAFGLLLIAALWTATLMQLAAGERAALAAGMRDTENFAAAYEQATRRALKDADRTTLLVKHAFEHYATFDLTQLMAAGLVESNSSTHVAIADAAGNIVASSIPLDSPVNIGDLDHFRRYARFDTGRLDISVPVVGRLSGHTVVLLARRLNDRDGRFAGAVMVSVTPDFFTDFYRESDLGQRGFIGTLGLDGIYRGHRTGRDAGVPPGAPDRALAARATAATSGSYEGTIGTDASPRLVSWRRLADYPLVIAAAQDRDEVLADVHATRATSLSIAALATAAIVALFAVVTALLLRLQRHRHGAQQERRFLQALVDNLPFGVSVREVESRERSRYVLWNDANEVLQNVRAADAIGRTVDDVLTPAAAQRTKAHDCELFASPMVQQTMEAGDIPGRGWRTLRTTTAPIFAANEEIRYLLSITSDITDEQAHADEIRLASKVFETTADAIILSDADDRVVVVNAAFTKLTGFTADEMIGRLIPDSPFRPIDVSEYEMRLARLHCDGVVTGEVPRCRKDGTPLALWLTATIVRDANGAVINYVRVFTDISPLKESQKKLEQLANYDPLTGLPNRRFLHERLERSMQRARRASDGLALMFIDLDGFKDVNDLSGHDCGDRLLQEVAHRLQGCLRENDFVARFGGDEFAILIEHASLPDDAERIANRIIAELSLPVNIGGRRFRATASIGIAQCPKDGNDPSTLLKHADIAMYRAKRDGRNRYAFYSQPGTSPGRPHLRAL